ncbi:citrate synthase, partial [Microbacterium sp. SUBG005]
RIQPGEIAFRGRPVQELIGTTGFVDTIWLLVTGGELAPARRRLLEATLVASVDHGPQAPSIASARMAATCVGINSAMANGINVLGDTHGGAGQQCVAMLGRMVSAHREDGSGWDDLAA